MLCFKKKQKRNGIYLKKNRKKSHTSKSHNNATEYVFKAALKSIIASLAPYCPKEILIEILKFINVIYPKLKDPCLNSVMKTDTVKRKELVWKNVSIDIKNILFPLIQATNTAGESLLQIPSCNPLDSAIKAYTQCQLSEKNSQIYWPKPLEINFLQIKDADDVATIICKVGDVTIPYAMIDSGSDSSIISENVAKHLGLKIDRKKVHRLNGVASKSQSLGTINNVPVTISDGENSDTVTDDFSVVPTEHDHNGKELSLFILGTPWQYRAGWEPVVKGEFRITRNGKSITIPLSVHKSRRNVFTVTSDDANIELKKSAKNKKNV